MIGDQWKEFVANVDGEPGIRTGRVDCTANPKIRHLCDYVHVRGNGIEFFNRGYANRGDGRLYSNDPEVWTKFAMGHRTKPATAKVTEVIRGARKARLAEAAEKAEADRIAVAQKASEKRRTQEDEQKAKDEARDEANRVAAEAAAAARAEAAAKAQAQAAAAARAEAEAEATANEGPEE